MFSIWLDYPKFSEDVNAIAHAVLRHRIIRNYKAEAEEMSVDRIISEMLEK